MGVAQEKCFQFLSASQLTSAVVTSELPERGEGPRSTSAGCPVSSRPVRRDPPPPGDLFLCWALVSTQGRMRTRLNPSHDSALPPATGIILSWGPLPPKHPKLDRFPQSDLCTSLIPFPPLQVCLGSSEVFVAAEGNPEPGCGLTER